MSFAWAFWTNVDNWVFDPAIDRVRVEPAFTVGALGTTVTRDGATTEWRVVDLEPGTRARIEIQAPGATLHIDWIFGPAEGGGSSLRQQMYLSGERADEYERTLAATMGKTVLTGMRQLAYMIDSAYDAERT